VSTELEQKAPTGLTVSDDGPLSYLLDTARFNHVWRIASAIAAATLLPDHLRLDRNKKPLPEKQVQSNVFCVVSQAIRWGFDPYAVVDETYVVAGRLGYQGKLIAAVVNARSGLKENLSFAYSGSGQDRMVTVYGYFVGEKEPRTITLSVAQAKTANKMWTSDPDQKLAYSGATKWARRHSPEVMLGVLTDDDLDRIRESRSINVASEPRSLEAFTGKPEPTEADLTAEAEALPEPAKVEPATATHDDVDPDQRLDEFMAAYEQADTLEEVDGIDRDAKTDPKVGDKPRQNAIFHPEAGYSALARKRIGGEA